MHNNPLIENFNGYVERHALFTHEDKILLTASGGPFRTWEAERIRRATAAEALAHPNWSMGKKVTVDSASMMNKALEIIERERGRQFDPVLADLFVELVRTNQIEVNQ